MKIGKTLVLGMMATLIVGLAPAFASTGADFPAANEETVIEGENGMNRIIGANKKIEAALVSGYKAIENGVVTGYKAIENGVVSGYKAIENKFTEAFLPSESGQKEAGN